MKKILKKNEGITLVALVVTIVVLLILTGITINMAIGDNGIITKAQETARKANEIQANSQSYLNELQQDVAEELANADIEIYLDKIESNVESVIITVEGTLKDDKIIEIECPDGSKVQGDIATYEVNKNGEYVFWIRTKKGRNISRNISVTNIKEYGIDLTGLVTGEDAEHSHIYEDKYDTENHWQQCMICNNIINQKSHNKQMTEWILGDSFPHCRVNNYATEYCTECGYNRKIIEAHPALSNQFIKKSGAYQHYKICTTCGTEVGYSCVKADGSKIDCNNLGQCNVCEYNYTMPEHNYYVNINTQEIYCANCRKIVGSCKYIITRVNTNTINVECNYEMKDGYTLLTDKNKYSYLVDDSINMGTTGIIITINGDSKKMSVNYAISINPNYKNAIYLRPDTYIVGDNTSRFMRGANIPLYYDNVKPIITNVQETNNVEVLGWTTNKSITITGEEDFSKGVYVTMEDSQEKKVIENAYVPVVNKQYSYSFSALLEADENGQDYKIIVKDEAENIVTSIKRIYKTDSQAPILLSTTQYNGEWSKIKKIKFEAQDVGVGKVEIAFNNILDYKKAEQKEEIYSREYHFIGDVYEDVTGAIYLKDGLGNARTEKIKIGKIDNTSPTINNVETKKEGENIVITITANDINEKLGQEGSGVGGYAITKTKQLPEDSMYQESNEIKVEKAGMYYIYVKDNVGNVSARYELNVEEGL